MGNDFTAPDFSYYERVTRVSGGYKKVGNMVYVQVSLKPKSPGYSFFTSGGGGGLACKLPRKHPDYPISIMFSVVVNKAIFGCCVYLYNDSSDERKGILNYVGPQVSAIDDTCNLTIRGAYITNE